MSTGDFPHWGKQGRPRDMDGLRTTGGGKPRPYGANHPPDLADTTVSVRAAPDAGRRALLAMTEGEREDFVNSAFLIPNSALFFPLLPA